MLRRESQRYGLHLPAVPRAPSGGWTGEIFLNAESVPSNMWRSGGVAEQSYVERPNGAAIDRVADVCLIIDDCGRRGIVV